MREFQERVGRPLVYGAICLLMLPFAAPLPGGAQSDGGPTQGCFFSCPRLSSPPVIDGKLDDACWKNATRLEQFLQVDIRERSTLATAALAGWDGDKLYVAFECSAPAPAPQAAKITEHDGPVWLDDNVQLFVAPEGQPRDYYHLAVNAAGTTYESKGWLAPGEWNPEIEVRVSTGEKGWTAEIAIPWKALSAEATVGQSWRVNFGRGTPEQGDTSWAPCREGLHDPEHLARMELGAADLVVTSAVVDDSRGDLAGGPFVRAKVANQGAGAAEVKLQAACFPGPNAFLSPPVAVPSGEEREITLPFRVGQPRYNRLNLAVVGARAVLARTDVPLEDNFLRGQLDQLATQLSSYRTFLQTLSTQVAERDAIAGQATEKWNELQALRGRLAAPELPSALDWETAKVDVQGLESAIANIGTLCAILRSYSPDELAQPTMVRRFVTFGITPFEKVTYATRPTPDDVIDSLAVTACQGEYQPATFGLAAAEALPDVRVSVATLKSGTRFFPADNVEVYVVNCWAQAGPGVRKQSGATQLVPELLLKDDEAPLTGPQANVRTAGDVQTSLAAGQSKQFWLTFWVPPDTPPDLYKGEIRIGLGEGKSYSVRLSLRVLPVQLVPTRQELLVEYVNTLSPGERSVSLARYQKELQDIRNHGFGQASLAESVKYLGAAARLRASLGMAAPAPYLGSLPAEGIGELEKAVQGPDLPPLIYMLGDSPDSTAALTEIQSRGELVHKGEGRTTAFTDLPAARRLGNILDVGLYDALDPQFSAHVEGLARGTESPVQALEMYWWPAWVEDAVRNRLLCGLYLWRSGLDGLMLRTYQRLSQGQDAFDDYSGSSPLRPQMLTYPAQEGPLPTLQWEAAREGIDDLRYLETLTYWLMIASSTLDDVATGVLRTSPAADSLHKEVLATQDLMVRIRTGVNTNVYTAVGAVDAGWLAATSSEIAERCYSLQRLEAEARQAG